MKQLLLIIVFAFFSCNQSKEYPKQGTKDILRASPISRIMHTPPGLDKLYGLNIYYASSQTTKGESRMYFVKVYCNYNGWEGIGINDDSIYDKVYYRWENDSLVQFCLFNSTSYNSLSYTYSCFKNNQFGRQELYNKLPIDTIQHYMKLHL